MTQNEQTQRDRFFKTARALGSDEDKVAFNAKLAVIAQQKVRMPKGPNDE